MSLQSGFRVPFFSVSFDASAAGPDTLDLRFQVLHFGQMLDVGTATPGARVRVFNVSHAKGLFGPGSQLAIMAEAHFRTSPAVPLYVIPLEDDPYATKSVKRVTFTLSGFNRSGTLNFLVDGVRVPVPFTPATTLELLTSTFVNAVNSNPDLPFTADTANPATGIADLTAKNGGTLGNDLDVRATYSEGDTVPDTLTIAIAGQTPGATDPDVTTALAAMGDEWFPTIVWPYYADLTELEAELEDRFGHLRQIDGVAFSSRRGSLGALLDYGDARNSKHICVIHSQGVPNSPVKLMATAGAAAAASAQEDPAFPLHNMPLPGLLPPAAADRFTILEDNQLLHEGISTIQEGPRGRLRTQRLITTFQEDENGNPSAVYLQVEKMFTLMRIRFDWRTYMQGKYGRAKIADDSPNLPAGQVILTPSVARAEALARFAVWQSRGWVENVEAFKANLQVERDQGERSRMNILLPPNLMWQLITVDTVIQFRE